MTKCRKTEIKVIPTANQKKENNLKSQREIKVNTTKLSKARENTGDQVVVDFSFASCSVAKSLIVTEQTPIYKKSFYTEISQIQRIQNVLRLSSQACNMRGYPDITSHPNLFKVQSPL